MLDGLGWAPQEMEAWRTTPKQLLKAGPSQPAGGSAWPVHHDTPAAAPAAAVGQAPRRAARPPNLLLQDADPEPGDHQGLPEPAGHSARGESPPA